LEQAYDEEVGECHLPHSVAAYVNTLAQATEAAPKRQLEEVDELTPVVEVGPWRFQGSLVMLSGDDGSLKNSVVRKGDLIGQIRSGKTTVAIKEVKLNGDKESIAMIRRECSILKELGNSHPHILPLLSCAELPAEVVLLTPFARHGDLSTHVRIGSQCVEELEVRRLTSQVVAALSYLHARSIVHGDVKPQNLLLTNYENAFIAQLADFGLSVKLPQGATSMQLDFAQGSHGYIPLEVIQRRELCLASDMFAVGVISFQLLAGYGPFYPPSQVHLELEFDPDCWGPLSLEARQFVAKLLATEPSERGIAQADTHAWLAMKDEDFVRARREPFSPQPLGDIYFHTCESSQALWEIFRPPQLIH
jgi:calcium/calmodulin-dependent protein kinase I